MPIEKLFPNFFRSAPEKNSHETDFFPETPWPEDKEPLEEEEEEDSAEVFPHQVIFLLDMIIEDETRIGPGTSSTSYWEQITYSLLSVNISFILCNLSQATSSSFSCVMLVMSPSPFLP